MDLRPGDTVYGENESEEYEIVEFINSGAFGFVYKIKKSKTGDFFALKTVPTAYLNEDELKALMNEGSHAPSVKHQNVVDVTYFHDGTQYEGLPPYIIMEYVPGGTLKDVLDEQRRSSRPFDNDQLIAMFLQLAEGMKAINSQLIHRDLKPDNILLSEDTLKISDFGLSKVVGAATRTQTFKGIQHIHYMAPEAWSLEENTIQMDIYSMGIVFYELATLLHPYDLKAEGDIFEAWKDAHHFQNAEVPTTKNSSLNTHLSQLIMKMIAKKPGDRYSNWDEIIQRIRAGEEEEKTDIDVGKLVEKAIQTKEKEEKERLEREKMRKAQEELTKAVHYQYEELVAGLAEVVDAFNSQYEGPNIELHDTSREFTPAKILAATIPGRGSVDLFVQPIYDDMEFRRQKVRAWGYFKNNNGRGFNVVLVLNKPEDLYGNWICLHNEQSPLARRVKTRPEPFPFQPFSEFREEIKHVNSIHVYQTRVAAFETGMILPLFEDIL